jgi:Holliday junction DNA helicase RuvA
MITHLNGTLTEKQPTRIVLDVGGVGYEVLVPLSSFDRLPPPGAVCRVLTYDCVREDSHQLFGFLTEAERGMFVLLLNVNGIGPKLALSALSGLTVREMKAAIAAGDFRRLSGIPGIGKKLAERIAVELRDRIDASDALEAAAGPASDAAGGDERLRDAILALVALGYRQDQARKMVGDVLKDAKSGSLGTEQIIKLALGR